VLANLYDPIFNFQLPLSGSRWRSNGLTVSDDGPFNSLSRDHSRSRQHSHFCTYSDLSTPSLGITGPGDPECPGVGVSLSTPSLGITGGQGPDPEGGMLACFQLPLSGSREAGYQGWGWWGNDLSTPNSLSRDHLSGLGDRRRQRSKLSTPSLGIT